MHPNIINRYIHRLSEMAKEAGSPIKRMKNGASMHSVDKPDTGGKNKGKMRPKFSKEMNTDSPYNTK